MTIEEAIVYSLATANHGMTTDQIAADINRRCLHVRRDGEPVTSAQVYAVIMHNTAMFCKDSGKIMLMV